jgi:hypothetical protein
MIQKKRGCQDKPRDDSFGQAWNQEWNERDGEGIRLRRSPVSLLPAGGAAYAASCADADTRARRLRATQDSMNGRKVVNRFRDDAGMRPFVD